MGIPNFVIELDRIMGNLRTQYLQLASGMGAVLWALNPVESDTRSDSVKIELDCRTPSGVRIGWWKGGNLSSSKPISF